MSKEPTRQFLNQQLEKTADQQPMTVYCGLCPGWSAEGTAQEARAASEAHRVDKHPELVGKRTIVRKKRIFSQAMSADREAEIEEERRKRMRALGLV